MCESNDKIPLCWHCRWIVGIFFLAVLIMWGIIYFLEKPGQQEALSHWISVLIFLVTIVCTAIPLYMNNRYLALEREVKRQKEELKEEIEEQKNLKKQIQEVFQETYSASASIYTDIAFVLTKTFQDRIEEVFPDVVNVTIVAIQYAIKSKNPDDIESIPYLIGFVHKIMKNRKDIRKGIDKDTIDLLQKLMQDDAIKNDEATYQKCIEIIYWVNEAKEEDGKA